MELVLRAAFLYIFILIVLRITGRRTLSQMNPFDLVLLIIIAESTDNSIIGQDNSLISTIIVILTFITFEVIMSIIKKRSKTIDKWLEGTQMIIVSNGKLSKKKLEQEKIDVDDILQAARSSNGIDRIDQIKYAILEKNGTISIIPKDK